MNGERFNVGVLLLLTGVLALLWNAGFLDPGAFWAAARYWPVLLILAGLYVALSRTRLWFIPSLAAVLAVIAFLGMGAAAPGDEGRMSLEEQLPAGVAEVELRLTMSAGRLELGVLSPAGDVPLLYAARIENLESRPLTALRRRDGRAHVEIREYGTPGVGWRRPPRWELQLARDVAFDLHLQVGAADAQLDLAGLNLATLNVEAGASRLRIRLGEPRPRTRIHIQAGAAETAITVPRGIGVQVTTSGVLVRTDFPPGFRQVRGAYTNPEFAAARATLEVEFSSAAGRLVIRYADEGSRD